MLDKYLPDYLLSITPLTNARGTSRASIITSTTSSNVWGSRVPETTPFPYIVVGDGHDIDFGQTADVDLIREVGCHNLVICGSTYNSIRQLHRDVIDALRLCRNRYIPTSIAADKMWVQCIIIKESEQFDFKPLDGGQVPMLGYNLLIKGAYDVP